METTLHELAHALVFSSTLTGYYRKPDGSTYSGDEKLLEVEYRGESGDILMTPYVKKWTAEHFGCPRINDPSETEDVFKGM